MAISEKQRHDLFTKFEETLGTEHAATMMELLPPVGWADVATKHDLDVLRRELMATVATKDDLQQLRRDLVTWLLMGMGVQTAVFGLLLAVD